ncbi:MAG TPA: tetratricopeptide repeat protein [Gemmatimonadaceae bacterium]|nr:tetratricopeptide repeat protein [Gemmatimonadaceae bacterium]
MRASLVSAFALAVMATVNIASAQKQKGEPRRPRLSAGTDTNSARAYYDYGLAQLERDPEDAANAFYWSIRLNPTQPDAYYARRCALLLTDKIRFQQYMDDDRRTLQSDEIKRIDSLYFYSLTINPFLYRGLDSRLFRSYLNSVADEYLRRNNVSIQYDINRWLTQLPPSFKAWRAYGEGNFPDALQLYADAIKAARFTAYLRAERGRLFFLLGQPDSALSELTQALDELRKADKNRVIYVYESKALLEHSIAIVHQRLGNAAAAKEAFAGALAEDLSYFPAHVQLATLAIGAKDTTTALSEMELAVQIRPDDPALRYGYGYILTTSGHFEDAEVQLRKAIEVDPDYASPYFMLGLVLDSEGKGTEAVTRYQAFLAHASLADPRRKEAEEHIRELAIKELDGPLA